MKTLKILSSLLLGIFLISLASAYMIVDYGQWQDGSQNIEITNGESVDFEYYLFSPYDAPITYDIKLYVLDGELVSTIAEGTEATNTCTGTLTITPDMYNSIDEFEDNLGVGDYELIVHGTDSAGDGDSATLFLTINEATTDTVAPIITLTGNNPVDVVVGTTYTDEGATAEDNVDGDLTSSIVVGGDIVDTDIIGTYVITYDVTDSSENSATQVTRTVNVVESEPKEDTTAPVITILGTNPVSVVIGTEYIDAGATATDLVDGSVDVIVILNNVNSDAIGIYSVQYQACDSSGNCATEIRTVNVLAEEDTEAPIITLTGDSEVEIYVGETYTDDGATAEDNVDGDLTSSIVVGGDIVDTDVIGTYVITYDVTDSSENSAIQVTRTVNVIEEDEDDTEDGTSGTTGTEEPDFYEEAYLAQNEPRTIYLEEDESEKELSWFQKIIKAIVDFFKRLFNIK